MFERIDKLAENVFVDGLSAIYINNQKTIFYLLGVNTSNGHFIVSKTKKIFITDGRYYLKMVSVLKNSDIEVLDIKNIKDGVISILKKIKAQKIGIEFGHTTIEDFNILQKKDISIKYVPIDQKIRKMRTIKSDNELSIIQEGVNYHEEIYLNVESKIKEGITEIEVKKLFDCSTLDVTSLGTSFETIVAFGENSAIPHHHSTNRKLKKGDTILIDSGINYKGYATDMTRTTFFDNISEKLEKTYALVYEAVQIGEKNISIGDFTSNPHKKVIEYFKTKKVEENYLHSLGHGVGLDIHENPSLGLKDSYKFEVGTVFTIEPGLYYENIGGIRLENMYFISNQGLKIFNKLDYKLKII